MLEKLKNFIKNLKVNIGWKSLVLIGVCGALLFVDLITKHFAVKDGWNFTVIPNFIEVVKVNYNDGAAFNILSGSQIFLIIVTFIMLIVLISVFIFLPERFILLKVAISMIVAGAVGNLVDRLAFNQVRDFVIINMLFAQPICNFADFWIVIGTIVAIIDILFINEWALFPLTKSAKAAQAKRAEEEKNKSEESVAQPITAEQTEQPAAEENNAGQTEEQTTEIKDENKDNG